MCQWYLGLEMLTHLVQSGLRHRVVIYPEKLFVLSEDAEDVSEGGEGGGKLVLQHVSVFFFQGASWQLALNEIHHGLQVRIWPGNPQYDGVPIAKSAGRGASDVTYASKLSYTCLKINVCSILIVLDFESFLQFNDATIVQN